MNAHSCSSLRTVRESNPRPVCLRLTFMQLPGALSTDVAPGGEDKTRRSAGKLTARWLVTQFAVTTREQGEEMPNDPKKLTAKVIQTLAGPDGLIEAAQFTGESALEVIEWAGIPDSKCFPAGENFVTGEPEDGYVVITTPRGDERVDLGYWIIRDARGGFDKMGAHEFSAMGFGPAEAP